MEIKILLTCILLVKYCKIVKSKVVQGKNTKQQNCTFVYSDCDYNEFLEAGALFETCIEGFNNPTLEVKMINCFLPAFPNGTFATLGYLNSFKLEIADGSQINLLSPMLKGFSVFENLNFKSAVFDICDSLNLAGWKWEALSAIEHGNINSFEFNVVRSNLIYLSSSFGNVAKGGLTNIRILKCRLRWLGQNVFAPLKNLVNLELRDNLIEHIHRSQLPVDASKLRSLDLGNNRLQHISTDFFQDLHLNTLLLDGNNVKILDHQMKILLEDSSLPFIHGVLWPCNCDEILEKFNTNMNHEQCYVKENIMDIIVFKEKCLQHKIMKKTDNLVLNK